MIGNTVKIDFNKAPEYQKDSLARALVEAMKAFYSDPENLKGYEEWMAREGRLRYPEEAKGVTG